MPALHGKQYEERSSYFFFFVLCLWVTSGVIELEGNFFETA